MSYQQLTALLDPVQFKQMEVVRAHLLQDPTTLDNHPEEKVDDLAQETSS